MKVQLQRKPRRMGWRTYIAIIAIVGSTASLLHAAGIDDVDFSNPSGAVKWLGTNVFNMPDFDPSKIEVIVASPNDERLPPHIRAQLSIGYACYDNAITGKKIYMNADDKDLKSNLFIFVGVLAHELDHFFKDVANKDFQIVGGALNSRNGYTPKGGYSAVWVASEITAHTIEAQAMVALVNALGANADKYQAYDALLEAKIHMMERSGPMAKDLILGYGKSLDLINNSSNLSAAELSGSITAYTVDSDNKKVEMTVTFSNGIQLLVDTKRETNETEFSLINKSEVRKGGQGIYDGKSTRIAFPSSLIPPPEYDDNDKIIPVSDGGMKEREGMLLTVLAVLQELKSTDAVTDRMAQVQAMAAQTDETMKSLIKAKDELGVLQCMPDSQYKLSDEANGIGATTSDSATPTLTSDQALRLREAFIKSGKPPQEVIDSKGGRYYRIELPKSMGGFKLLIPVT